MWVGIIGSGITGLTLGYYLTKLGYKVNIFEKGSYYGGLLSYFLLDNLYLEKYYHHIFLTDKYITGLIEELNLGQNLIFKKVPMGLYYKGKIYPFGTPKDLCTFKPLSFIEKINLGIVTLYLQMIKNWKKLESYTASEWLKNKLGVHTYEIVWEPLLRGKFGEKYCDISMAWLWGKISVRSKSRKFFWQKEQLGYLKGGFKLLIDSLEKEIIKRGGEIIKNFTVEKIFLEDDSGKIQISGSEGSSSFDKVIVTIPCAEFVRITPQLPLDYVEKLSRIQYLSTVCLVLILTKKLSNIYWMNINDQNIPFIGLVEHTNFMDKKDYKEKNIVYIANYVPMDSAMYNLPDTELFNLYMGYIKMINPDFSNEWVEDYFVFKDRYAQPVIPINYSSIIPSYTTSIKNLYLVNNSQIYPQDRGINYSVKLTEEALKIIDKN